MRDKCEGGKALVVCLYCVHDAVDAGYRLFDTATAYGNEEALGRALAAYGVPRDELFITTKLWLTDASCEGAHRAFTESLKKLGLDYLDLYLIHQPLAGYYESKGVQMESWDSFAEGKK